MKEPWGFHKDTDLPLEKRTRFVPDDPMEKESMKESAEQTPYYISLSILTYWYTFARTKNE